MSDDILDFVKEKINELRLKLLDLTNRNPLLNFRHSEKSLTQIRIIDELPDFLFGEILKGTRLAFKSLPEPGNEPSDEETDEFRIEFRTAVITDEKYLNEIKELEDQDDSFDEIAKSERNLKDRIRKKIGLVNRTDIKPFSNAKWARKNNIEPKYDMPIISSDSENLEEKHEDGYIQTLLKPKELLHKLSGLKRYINSDLTETGVNTFYVAFGFLEYFDSEKSERPRLSPLVLVQLDPFRPIKEEKKKNGQIEVSINGSGEPPQFNLPLSEKLKNDFGIALPIFKEDDLSLIHI